MNNPKNYVKLIAPAKMNLVLAVGGKLPDGYHEVHTIMHALALHDTIEIRRTDLEGTGNGLSVNLSCEVAEGVEDLDLPAEENIAYRAAIRLAEALERTADEHIDIALSKRIPHQAGLGGGSSDAAATLKGLALLWDVPLESPVLAEVAAGLGADVAFFLYGGCAYLDGKGEHFVHALEPRKGFLTLVRPEGDGVSTKDAYAAFDAHPEFPTAAFLEEVASYQRAADVALWNNLTDAAQSVKPELSQVFEALEKIPGVNAVLLCGSGSATAAICDSYESACEVSLVAHKQGWYARTTSFASIGAEVLKSF